MKVLVAGIGGVGGFLGAKLARAYDNSPVHEIYFLARGNHLDAVKNKGLTLVSQGSSFAAYPKAVSDKVDGWPQMDLVILCVKGYDLETTVGSVRAVAGAKTKVLPLQNGIGKRELIQGLLPASIVLDGTIYVFAHIQAPGTIVHVGGPGKVVLGGPTGVSWEDLLAVETLLKGAKITAEVVPDIDLAVWKKFLVLAPVAGLTSLYGETVGQILAQPSKLELLETLMVEVAELARKCSVRLDKDAIEEGMRTVRAFPPDGKSSLLHDLEAGKMGELRWLLGRALAKAMELGLSMPNMSTVYAGIYQRWFGRPPGINE